jgi:hypothetical protein
VILNRESLKNSKPWEAAGISLPQFEIEEMRVETQRKPEWLHWPL